MEKSNPAQIHAITSSLNNQEQTVLQKVVQEAKERMEEADKIHIPELHLNGN